MPTLSDRTVFDGADKTQLYSQKRLNVKSPCSQTTNSQGKLYSATRRAVFPCTLYRLVTMRTFGKIVTTGKVSHIFALRTHTNSPKTAFSMIRMHAIILTLQVEIMTEINALL